MTREQKYMEQLRQIGIYQEAFDPEIHTLAMMERECQRLTKRWKAAGSFIDDANYAAIVTLRRDILAHRDALGLTPKGLNRLRKGGVGGKESQAEKQATVLELVRSGKRAEA